MGGTLAPFAKSQYFDNNGDPASGYKLFTYAAGTSTKLATYTDQPLTTPNANPIVLDSAGRATLFLSPASYKFVMTTPGDSDPPASPIWTQDNISAIPLLSVNTDVSGVAGETLTANDAVYLSAGDGGRNAGRWYKTDADLYYAAQSANAVGFVLASASAADSITVRVGGRVTGLSGLTAGVTQWVSSTPGAIAPISDGTRANRLMGVADTTTSLIVGFPRELGDVLPFAILSTVGNVGAGEDTLQTYTMVAGAYTPNNARIRIVAFGNTANNANVKTIRLRLIEGANNNVLTDWAATINEAGHWRAEAEVYRSSPTLYKATAMWFSGTSAGPVTASGVRYTTGTITWANAVEVRVTGEATTNNDITCEGVSVMFVPNYTSIIT